MWLHHFDWPYRQTLRAPWYSGLAQGNGLSMLVRAARHSDNSSFGAAAHQAFESMRLDVSQGGVIVTEPNGNVWIEEYMVDPPSHILNGYIWALWGVYDYAKWCGDAAAWSLWHRCVPTLLARIDAYDTGWWSLYELPVTGATPMLASRYYHTLHITQLHVMHRLTGIGAFRDHAIRFEQYLAGRHNVARAFVGKALFKLRNY
ncbi:MAG: D-glucuronyl C5-epimerase family protein, partial [Acidobacteriota bacterium]